MKKILFIFSYRKKGDGVKVKSEKIINVLKKANCKISILCDEKGSIWYKRIFDLCLLYLKYLWLIIKGSYDIIYIRYDYLYLSIFITNILFNKKCQIEINSKSDKEWVCLGHPARAKISKISLLLASFCCNRVHYVTPEIKEYYKKLFLRSENVYSPNFVVDEYFQKKNNFSDRKKIRLIFMGNTFQKWQGLEKFINKVIMDNNWFYNNCELHILGTTDKKFIVFVTKNYLDNLIFIHGFLEGQKKREILAQMDVGVGVMSLSEKNLSQATPIKIAEYLYSGLPVIIGYCDPRLSGKLSFVLRINIDERPEKLQSMVNEFIKFIIKSPNIKKEAHKYAKQNMLVDGYIDNILRP
ncbi:MAG: glycosyltransferase [Candidatus Helarchaeota archaeon]